MQRHTPRPRRSVLYMPGSKARALEKGRSLDCDGIILDLEDAVAPDAKEAARSQIREAVSTGGYGHRELIIRVNGLDTPWGLEDLLMAAKAGAHGVLLPKVESADTVRRAEAVLDNAGAPEGLKLWVMMETPIGILRAEEIAFSTPRLAGFVMGTSDLAKDLHCLHTPERLPFVTALGIAMLAGRAAGLALLDGVYLDLNNADGYAAACAQGRAFGFDGKTLIHPKQLAEANRAFAPSDEEVAWSRKIIDAHAAAQAQGQGVLLVDGRLIENLHVADAKRIVALADAIDAATQV